VVACICESVGGIGRSEVDEQDKSFGRSSIRPARLGSLGESCHKLVDYNMNRLDGSEGSPALVEEPETS
jgi:hypothetical protein